MSTKNKTREKLMGSMRKTKAGAGMETDKKQVDSESVTSSKPATPPEPKRARAAATKKSDEKRATAVRDTYQSGQRVWPD